MAHQTRLRPQAKVTALMSPCQTQTRSLPSSGLRTCGVFASNGTRLCQAKTTMWQTCVSRSASWKSQELLMAVDRARHSARAWPPAHGGVTLLDRCSRAACVKPPMNYASVANTGFDRARHGSAGTCDSRAASHSSRSALAPLCSQIALNAGDMREL